MCTIKYIYVYKSWRKRRKKDAMNIYRKCEPKIRFILRKFHYSILNKHGEFLFLYEAVHLCKQEYAAPLLFGIGAVVINPKFIRSLRLWGCARWREEEMRKKKRNWRVGPFYWSSQTRESRLRSTSILKGL